MNTNNKAVSTDTDEFDREVEQNLYAEMQERDNNRGVVESDKIDSELNNLMYQFKNDENFTGLEF